MRLSSALLAAYIGAVAACHTSEAASDEVDLGPAPSTSKKMESKHSEPINPRLLRRFRPLEPVAPPSDLASSARIALGQQLYFDKRLSARGDTSCDTCHSLEHNGAEPRPVSIGSAGVKGTRNAPTVYNAAWHVAQFWDGREPDVERQAVDPILGSTEMAMGSPDKVTAVLRSIPGYADPFLAAFGPGSVDFAHATRAIAAFERTLSTPSRWDAYLQGDRSALSQKELDGLKVFADSGCVDCHTGELVGASMFQKAGRAQPWPNQKDQGRFEVTHEDADRMMFKVPSLRNVTITAPYFHDGSVASLPEAVRMMGKYQIGADLEDDEVAAIVAWLGSLTGTAPKIVEPELPADGPTTKQQMSLSGR